MNRSTLALCLALLGASLPGCGASAQLDAPPGFAELEGDDHFAQRLTSASGVVIGVRSEDNDVRGNLDFWTEALDNKLRRAGYAPSAGSKKAAVTTRAGLSGHRLTYELNRGGRRHLYTLAVFVDADRVLLVEAGGDEAYFDDRVAAQIAEAIEGLRAG